jgi:hypothetical protein
VVLDDNHLSSLIFFGSCIFVLRIFLTYTYVFFGFTFCDFLLVAMYIPVHGICRFHAIVYLFFFLPFFLKFASEYLISEFAEFLALQRLRMKISDHIIGRTIFNRQISFLNLICEKEIAYIQCSGPLARALLAICLQQNSTLVVLV